MQGEGNLRKDRQNIADDLIESTKNVIARDGLDKASTRNIAREIDLADAYIYQYFPSKEALFAQTFLKEDSMLSGEVQHCLAAVRQISLAAKEHYRFLFGCIWKYLMENPDSCRFYVQYYYSPYYQKNSAPAHLQTWQPMLDSMSVFFKPDADEKAILRLVLNTTLGLAIKALDSDLQNDDGAADRHFEMIFGIMLPWLIIEEN